MRSVLLQSIESLAKTSANKEEAMKILEEIQEIKKLKIRDAASILSDVITIGGWLRVVMGI